MLSGRIVSSLICHKMSTLLKSTICQMSTIPISLTEDQKSIVFSSTNLKLKEAFEKYNHEVRFAGGCVRDVLISKVPSDIDLASTATPDEMLELAEKESFRVIEGLGATHGTITFRIDETNIEVTTLRIDAQTDGRHAIVEYTRDWELDSIRRDLTINSMFLDFQSVLYDYNGGRNDLLNGRIRFVGQPEQRIREDYLRILRYFRFHGRLARPSNHHENDQLEAIKHNCDGLRAISGERIWTELKKILTKPTCVDLLKVMASCNLFQYIGFPDIDSNDDCYKELQKFFAKAHLYTEHSSYFTTDELCPFARQGMSPNNEQPAKIPLLSVIPLSFLFMNRTNSLDAMRSRLKISNNEFEVMRFLCSQQKEQISAMTERSYQRLAILDRVPWPVLRQLLVVQCIATCDTPADVDRFDKFVDEVLSWRRPKFPITMAMLEASMGNLEAGTTAQKRKQAQRTAKFKLSQVMKDLLVIWFESDFRLDSDDLVKMVDFQGMCVKGAQVSNNVDGLGL